MDNMKVVKFFRMYSDVKNPSRSHKTDSGVDIFAYCPNKPIVLKPFVPTAIPTGIKLKIAPGYEVQVRSRSGNALRGVFVLNSPGTIDAGYEGEVKVILMYVSNDLNSEFIINHGMKIAQLVVSQVNLEEWIEIDQYIEESDRGKNGFGSTDNV